MTCDQCGHRTHDGEVLAFIGFAGDVDQGSRLCRRCLDARDARRAREASSDDAAHA